MDDGRQCPFFAMQEVQVADQEERLYGTLFRILDQLVEQSGLTPEQLQASALLLGSTSLDISVYQPDVNKPLCFLPPSDNITSKLANHLGIGGLHFTINTACTASLNALLYGQKLLQLMDYQHVIVVGCEFHNELTVNGFYSLDLISQRGELSAFHQQRDGLILGEGVGALLLSADKPEGPAIELLDGYSSCDSYSLTTTKEDGSHILQVINQALEYAGVSYQQIDLIKVHGTATRNNDDAEFNALAEQFPQTPIWPLKPFIGHTLGACGVLELAIMYQLLGADSLPVPHYAEQTEQLLMPFAPADKGLASYQHILLNHCGFGGNNAAYVVKVHSV